MPLTTTWVCRRSNSVRTARNARATALALDTAEDGECEPTVITRMALLRATPWYEAMKLSVVVCRRSAATARVCRRLTSLAMAWAGSSAVGSLRYREVVAAYLRGMTR